MSGETFILLFIAAHLNIEEREDFLCNYSSLISMEKSDVELFLSAVIYRDAYASECKSQFLNCSELYVSFYLNLGSN